MTEFILGYLKAYGGFDLALLLTWLLTRAIGPIADFDKAMDLRSRLTRTALRAGGPGSRELTTLLAQLDELRYAFPLSKTTGNLLMQVERSRRAYEANRRACLPPDDCETYEETFHARV